MIFFFLREKTELRILVCNEYCKMTLHRGEQAALNFEVAAGTDLGPGLDHVLG